METKPRVTQRKESATQEKAVVQWKGEAITISFHDVKNLICPYASNQETVIFLRTCQSLNLNPFANEIYLIKYSERDKAAIVIAIDSYLKSAETNNNYNGHEAGIILKDSSGKLEFREGSFLLTEETDKLVGGWAKVYRTDREKSFYMSVNKAECVRYTRDGNLTKFWTEENQPMMLRKTALKRALVEAFPSLFSGTLSNVEADYEVLPEEVEKAVPRPRGETPEGELPPAYERNGEAYWKFWWARQKEKGLDSDEVHSILGISSLKTDWLEKGRTLEEAEDIINNALEQAAKPEAEKGAKDKRQLAWDTIRQMQKSLSLDDMMIASALRGAHPEIKGQLRGQLPDRVPPYLTMEMLMPLCDRLEAYQKQAKGLDKATLAPEPPTAAPEAQEADEEHPWEKAKRGEDIDAEQPSPQPEDPMAAWDEVRALIKELKPPEEKVRAWWQQTYNLPVALGDFRFTNPPEKFGDRMIMAFRDRLRETREAQQKPLL